MLSNLSRVLVGMGLAMLLSACGSSTATPGMGGGISLSVLAGTLTGPVGHVDNTGTAASFDNPQGVVIDNNGNVYVADTLNDTLRRVSPLGVVTTWAGTTGQPGSVNATGTASSFNVPHGLAIDQAGNVYVADTGNNLVREVSAMGAVTTLAGSGVIGSSDGTGAAASFDGPLGVAVDYAGNVYVTDSLNNTIRKITQRGAVTTLAGTPGVTGSADGSGAAAAFNGPEGMVVDASGNLYVADTGNHAVRKITPSGIVSTLAGNALLPGTLDGSTSVAEFSQPISVAINVAGVIYVLDKSVHALRMINAGTVSTLLNDASSNAGILWQDLPLPLAITLDVHQQPVMVTNDAVVQGMGF